MSTSISIALAIPTRDRPALLHRALQSVYQQIDPPDEILIGDNSTMTESRHVCLEWSLKLPRLRYIRREMNLAALQNFMFLVHEATSDYFLWLADDDVLEPGAIAAIREFMAYQPRPDYLGWAYQTKNYITGELTHSAAPPAVRTSNSCYMNLMAFLEQPASSFFYGFYRREILKDSILNSWVEKGITFDWMDVTFIMYMVSRYKSHFLECSLVTYGIDELVRPRRSADGEISTRYDPWPWLCRGCMIIIQQPGLLPREKIPLILRFLKAWKTTTQHVLGNG